MVSSKIVSVSPEWLSTQLKDLSYVPSTRLKARALAWNKLLCADSSICFKSLQHIMGVVVKEMTNEIRMATDRVTANSRNKRPTMPLIIRMGINTATREILMERTVKPISLAPLRAASIGE